jgi:hypothetical protein
VLRRIHGPKRKGVTGDCRKLHNEELHNFYIRTLHQMLSERSNQGGLDERHVAHMGETINAYKILVEDPNVRKRGHLEDAGIDGMEILIWVLQK